MDYRKTLNLPRTDFPMKANLPRRELEILRFWENLNIYRRVQELNADKPKWVLHDGPPYANGNIHLGQALNKILKDIAVKYKSMRGFNCPYVPGWDTQGLPTENSVTKELGLDRHKIPAPEWRRHCRELALKYVNLQREQFKRLGVRGDWDRPYLTLTKDYQAAQLEAFSKIALSGLLYRRLRPVYWCYHCETALAEAEIEYQTKTSDSIDVAFHLLNPEVILDIPDGAQAFVLIWTTTPWTIPGDTATALRAEAHYVLARANGRYYLAAEELIGPTMRRAGVQYELTGQVFTGQQLADAGLRYEHPLYPGKELPLVVAPYVVLDEGTGCVHTAPGHGLEDWETAQEFDLEVLSPLDDFGRFTDEAPDFLRGHVCDQANRLVIERLQDLGLLLHAGTIEHEYPHCWRCDSPVIYRATKQWFLQVEPLRRKALDEIARAEWVPAWGEKRISGMVENRPDYCMSRQRVWGVPLPIFYCTSCREPLITEASLRAVRDLVAREGADVWWEKSATEILPPDTKCPACGAREFTKESDIMDVWFDSGCSHYAVLRRHPELAFPADLYLEGDDQYQCWFQMSLLVAVALGDPAPFRTVVGHAFFVDKQGQKLSKRKGNILDPKDIYDRYGADVLRLWFIYADFRRKMFAAPHIFDQVANAYRAIRNCWRFMLGNLGDFNPAQDAVPYHEMVEIDRYALLRLNWLIERATRAYERWDLHLIYHDLQGFCANDLSAFYFKVIKDRLYTTPAASPARRSAQTALWRLALATVRLAAPVLTFTSEEVWQQLRKRHNLADSVQLAGWPEPSAVGDRDIETRWTELRAVSVEVNRALEAVKASGILTDPLEGAVDIYCSPQRRAVLESFGDELKFLLVVSEVALHDLESAPADARAASDLEGVVVAARPAAGQKCERCWMVTTDVGADPDHPTICARCARHVAAAPP